MAMNSVRSEKNYDKSRVSAYNLGQVGGKQTGVTEAYVEKYAAGSDSAADSQDGLKCKQLRVLRVVSVSMAFSHIWGQLEIYKEEGRDIVLASDRDEFFSQVKELGLPHEELNICREISPLCDLISIYQLIKIIRKIRPHVLHSSTPKAGFLCAIAGALTRVPVRIHTFTGQRWATLNGFKKWLLKKIDTFIAGINTKVYSDSPSQNQFLVEQGIVKKEKISCLHKGSLGGIDLRRFNRNAAIPREEILKQYQIPSQATILLYLGRINRDKGINELVTAFINLNKKIESIYLFLVGPLEDKSIKLPENIGHMKVLGATLNPEKFYSVADIFCLPSYREGFGTAVLEASAYGIPSVGTRIPGLVDSIEDNVTGFLVEPRNTLSLETALEKMICQKDLRRKLGQNAYKRIVRDFDYKLMAKKQWQEYQSLIS